MNRKITKTMAAQAATAMKNKVYWRKIGDATERVNIAVECLVRKYIPLPVINIVNEYSRFFGYSTGASITTVIEKNGWTTTASAIKGTLTFKIPSYATTIKVDNKDYDALQKLDSERKMLEEKRDKFGEEAYKALILLGNEKAVEKEFPEAMEYLVFPKVKALPMPVFSGLREVVRNIEDENKGQ